MSNFTPKFYYYTAIGTTARGRGLRAPHVSDIASTPPPLPPLLSSLFGLSKVGCGRSEKAAGRGGGGEIRELKGGEEKEEEEAWVRIWLLPPSSSLAFGSEGRADRRCGIRNGGSGGGRENGCREGDPGGGLRGKTLVYISGYLYGKERREMEVLFFS